MYNNVKMGIVIENLPKSSAFINGDHQMINKLLPEKTTMIQNEFDLSCMVIIEVGIVLLTEWKIILESK